MRQEIELARAELQQKGVLAGRGAGMLGGAAIAALLALGALSAGLVALLDKAMATWIGRADRDGAVGDRRPRARQGRPEVAEEGDAAGPQTVETVKEDIQWAKNPTGSAPR